jgi:hypothetical protein
MLYGGEWNYTGLMKCKHQQILFYFKLEDVLEVAMFLKKKFDFSVFFFQPTSKYPLCGGHYA